MAHDKAWIGYYDDSTGNRFEIDPNLLVKHGGIFGSTGSGKTVLGKILIEEMALQKVPSIVIDPQGDLASLIIPNDDETLKEKGVDLDRKEEFFATTEIRVFTPSSNKGIPISLNPVIFPQFNIDEVEVVRILDNVANTLVELLVKLVKYPPAKVIQSKSVIYTILLENWNRKKTVGDLKHLSSLMQEDDDLYQKFMNKSEKDKLVIAMNNLLIGSTGLLFSGQAKLDIGSLLEPKDDKTPVNVFFLKSLLNENEKHLFVSILIQALYSWMIQQGSSPTARCFFYMDEMAPFMPAGMSAPPGKAMLLLLLRQARKYGISCVLASQSPKDIDYHGLDQINSFFFGRILSDQSQRVIKNLLDTKMNPDRVDDILGKITTLTTGQFIGFLPDMKEQPTPQFRTRYLFSKHNTLTEADLKKIFHPDVPEDDIPVDSGVITKVQSEGEIQIEAQEGPSIISISSSSEGSDTATMPSSTTAPGYYRFKQLKEKAMEDLLERTIEYDFFEKITSTIKIRKFINLTNYSPAMIGYVKKMMAKFEYESIFEGTSPNGLLVNIFQHDNANIIVAIIIAENVIKVGLFGTFTSNQLKGDIEKLLDGISEICKKIIV
ncbi:MAG: ATP-binding protein [Candidatus Sigynarchaeota archaeon]